MYSHLMTGAATTPCDYLPQPCMYVLECLAYTCVLTVSKNVELILRPSVILNFLIIYIKVFCSFCTDYKPVTHTRDTVHVALFACYSVLAILGILFAVVCMVFIIVFREKM